MTFSKGDEVIVIDSRGEAVLATIIEISHGCFRVETSDGERWLKQLGELVDNAPDVDIAQRNIHIISLQLEYWRNKAKYFYERYQESFDDDADWEHRRWELAKDFYLKDSQSHNEEDVRKAVINANHYIDTYKEFLNLYEQSDEQTRSSVQ